MLPHLAAATPAALDREALALRGARDGLLVDLSRAARGFVHRRGWSRLGHARLDDYARERLGRTGRWLRERAGVGRALANHPRLEAALRGTDGGPPLGQVAAVVVARVCSPAALEAWIALARAVTARQLREAARRARRAKSAWPLARDGGGSPGAAGPAAGGASPDTSPSPSRGSADAPIDYLAWLEDLLERDPADRSTVRLPVPSPVRAAFDEALDLFRAVEGKEASVASFVESLEAEAASGGSATDEWATPIVGAEPRADREEALAAATGRWERLPPPGPAKPWEGAGAPPFGPWANADEHALDALLRELLRLDDEIDRRLGRVLLRMAEMRAFPALGFLDAGHYAEERLGMSRTAAEARIRLARAARRFPALRRAYDSGAIGQQAGLLVAQALRATMAAPGAESRWVEEGAQVTVKRLRDTLRWLGSAGDPIPGGGPPSSSDGSGSTLTCASPSRRDTAPLAGLADHAAGPGRKARGILPPTDEEWHASIRREPGFAQRRVRGWGLAALAAPEAGDWLRLTLPKEAAQALLAAVECRRAALADEVAASGGECSDDAAPSLRIAAATGGAGRRVPAWAGLLALLEEFVEVWDDPRGMPRRPGDRTYERDGYRCAAPGCTSRRNLEEHHVTYRSQGGADAPGNLVTLCAYHHRQGEHGGLASVEGVAPLGLLWRLGPREGAEWFRNERRLG